MILGNVMRVVVFLYFLAVATGCKNEISTAEADENHQAPIAVPLKVTDKYYLNPINGDSIKPLRNSKGEIVRTGEALDIAAENWKNIPVVIQETPAGNPYYHTPLEATPEVHPQFRRVPVKEERLDPGSIYADTLPLRINKLQVLTPNPVDIPQPKKPESASENIQLYDIDHGLKSLVLWDGLEDHLGNIWCVAEGGGISTLNGAQMQTFTKKEGITTEVLLCIHQDSEKNIWFGGWGGNVMKYDGREFYEINLLGNDAPPEVNQITEDSTGAIWLSTAEQGVFMIRDSMIYHFKELEHIGPLKGVACGPDSSLYLGGEKGFIHVDGSEYTAYIFPERIHEFGVRPVLNRGGYDDWFILWGYGIVRRDESGFYACTTRDGLISNRVMDIVLDQNENIWIGTQGGLQKFSEGRFKNFTESAGLAVNDVYGIHVDKQNNLWLALSGGGLAKFNQNGLSHWSTENWLPSDQLSFITEWKDGRKVVGFWGNGLMLENEEVHMIFKEDQGLRTNYVLNMYSSGDLVYYQDFYGMGSFDGSQFTYYDIPDETYVAYNYWQDDDTTLWIGTKQYGLIKMVADSFHQLIFPDLDIAGTYPMYRDKQGDLWVGVNEILARIRNDKVTYFSGSEGFLNNNPIQRITQDAAGNIWLATRLGGLFKFDGSSFTQVLQGDLSQDGDVYLTVDRSERVWLMAPFQLSVISPKVNGYQVTNYSKKKGLINHELSSLLNSSDGNIYVGGRDGGVDIFDLDDYKIEGDPPRIAIKSIAVNGNFLDPNNLAENQTDIAFSGIDPFTSLPQNLELNFQDNHITLSYAGIDWSGSDDILYRYQLSPLEESWSTLTSESSVDYRNLPYGNLDFRVRAMGQGQEWSDIASFKFRVNPPYWYTWQAYVLYGLLLILVTYLITQLRISNLRRRQALMEAEIKAATIEISKQKEKAEQSEKYKEQFLANMSHEIRTPLNAIIGMVKIIKRRNHPDFQDLYLDAMAQSSTHLSLLLNDILDLSKIEAGKLEIDNIPLELKKTVDQVTLLMRFKAEQKGLRIHSDIDRQLPSYIMGDPHRLTQILINLVSNAIKYSESGVIKLLVQKTENKVQFSVSDQGVGISEDDLPLIFDSFTQSQNANAVIQEGAGLGLSIAKHLVEIQGGHIWVKSIIGKGSTFYFDLPLVLAPSLTEEAPPDKSALRNIAQQLGNMDVLLVDDDEFNLMIARDEFEWFFPEVKLTTATDGKTAFELWEKDGFDLVVTDIQMPVLDGHALTHKIRMAEEEGHGKGKQTVILALTASVLNRDIDQCLSVGMNGYIPKPFNSHEFVVSIYNAMRSEV